MVYFIFVIEVGLFQICLQDVVFQFYEASFCTTFFAKNDRDYDVPVLQI